MLSQQIRLSPDALFQEIGGEAVILDLSSSTYFGLDDIGVRIWKLLQEGAALVTVRQQLLAEYDVESKQLEQDINAFVQQLCQAGLASVV
jgi:hypothetical protein